MPPLSFLKPNNFSNSALNIERNFPMKIRQHFNPFSKLNFALIGGIFGAISLFGYTNSFASDQASDNAANAQSGPYIVLIGAPASGKSTNGKSIAQNFGIPLINMGEVVTQEVERISKRPIVTSGSARARSRARRSASLRAALVKLEEGELVSDAAMDAIVAARIMREDAHGGFVLDGYPGSVRQAEYLDGLLEANNIGPAIVILLDVPDEISIKRMAQRAREDDTRGFGEERLHQYRENIAPILEFYGDAVSTVDATKTLEQVEQAINNSIKKELD
jgi:adenylate kinase